MERLPCHANFSTPCPSRTLRPRMPLPAISTTGMAMAGLMFVRSPGTLNPSDRRVPTLAPLLLVKLSDLGRGTLTLVDLQANQW